MMNNLNLCITTSKDNTNTNIGNMDTIPDPMLKKFYYLVHKY